MKPLVEELDESAGRQIEGLESFQICYHLRNRNFDSIVLIYFGPVNVPGLDLLTHSNSLLSAGERSRVDLGALDEVAVPSYQESPPTASGPQAQTSPADLDQGRSRGTGSVVWRSESRWVVYVGSFRLFQVGSRSTS